MSVGTCTRETRLSLTFPSGFRIFVPQVRWDFFVSEVKKNKFAELVNHFIPEDGFLVGKRHSHKSEGEYLGPVHVFGTVFFFRAKCRERFCEVFVSLADGLQCSDDA